MRSSVDVAFSVTHAQVPVKVYARYTGYFIYVNTRYLISPSHDSYPAHINSGDMVKTTHRTSRASEWLGEGGFSGFEVIGVIRAGLTSSQTADLLGAFTLRMVWKRERIEQASSSGFAEALQHWTVWVGKTLASLMNITILIIYYYSDLLFICYIDFYTCTAWDVSHKKCWALVVLTCLSLSCVKSELYVWCWQGEPSGCMNILLISDTDYCILACVCFSIHCVGFAYLSAPHSFQETYSNQADAVHMSRIYIFIDMQENM